MARRKFTPAKTDVFTGSSGLLNQYDQKQHFQAMLDSFLTLFTRVDSVLAGRPIEVVTDSDHNLNPNSAPAYTDGNTIYFRSADVYKALLPLVNGQSKQSSKEAVLDQLAWLRGLNYHELAHCLFSPNNKSHLRKTIQLWENHSQVPTNYNYRRAFNILEDARIETLFVSKYPSSRYWFTSAVVKYITKHTKAGDQSLRNYCEKRVALGWLLVYGRRYLSNDLRQASEKAFVKHCKVSNKDLTHLKSLIDEYRKATMKPSEQGRAAQIIREFTGICERLGAFETDFGADANLVGGSHEFQSKGTTNGNYRDATRQQDVIDRQDEEFGADDNADTDATAGESGDGEDADNEAEQGNGSGDGEDSEEGHDGGSDKSGNSADSRDGRHHDSPSSSSNEQSSEQSSADSQSEAEWDAVSNLDPNLSRAVANAEAFSNEHIRRDALDILRTTTTNADKIRDVRLLEELEEPAGMQVTPAEFRSLASSISTALTRYKADTDNQWEHGAERGRLHLLRHATARGLSTDFFDEWVDEGDERPDAEVVVLLDLSSSMDHHVGNYDSSGHRIWDGGFTSTINEACAAMWAIKYACQQSDIPCSVLGYENSASALYNKSTRVGISKYPLFRARGGTHPESALAAALRILEGSDAKHKLLFSITDGQWVISGDAVKRVYDMTTRGKISSFFIQLPMTCTNGVYRYDQSPMTDTTPSKSGKAITQFGHGTLIQTPNSKALAKVIGKHLVKEVVA